MRTQYLIVIINSRFIFGLNILNTKNECRHKFNFIIFNFCELKLNTKYTCDLHQTPK
jgi:hypothetical protein